MIFGLPNFAQESFAQVSGDTIVAIKIIWTEICGPNTSWANVGIFIPTWNSVGDENSLWTEIPSDPNDIERC